MKNPLNGHARIIGIITTVAAGLVLAFITGGWNRAGIDHDELTKLRAEYNAHEDWGREKYAEVIKRFDAIDKRFNDGVKLDPETVELLKRIERRTR